MSMPFSFTLMISSFAAMPGIPSVRTKEVFFIAARLGTPSVTLSANLGETRNE